MDIQEKEAIEMQFERNLDLLIKQKIPLTATAIVSAEQPMIFLFKELIYRIEKREYELDKKDKIIDLMAEELADWYMDNLIDNRKIDKQYVINKFTNKVEEDK